MSYLVSGIAFSAMPTNHLDFNNNNTTQETLKIEDKEYSYKTSNSYATLVEFRDSTNDKSVSVSLNDNVLEKLTSHFLEEDFHKNKDGNIELSGEAEKFVSGWFGDIAYKREFLSADTNQDGNLDSSEYLNTKNDFHIKGAFYNATNIEEKVTTNYSKISEQKYSNYIKTFDDRVKNIDEELNKTIDSDENLDGKMTLKEAYNTIGGSGSVLLSHAKEMGLLDAPQKSKNMFDTVLSKKNNLSSPKNNQEDELKKQQALMKLLQANGDASKLTAEEKALLGSELQQYSKDITDELSNSLSKTLDSKINNELNEKTKITKEETKKLNTLEKLQTDQTQELSKDEKSQIASELKRITNKDGTIDSSKLDDIVKHIKVSQTYNEKEDTKMLGRYYETKG